MVTLALVRRAGYKPVMLYANSGIAPRIELTTAPHGPDEAPVWLDLLEGDDSQRSLVERLTGLRVPSLHDLSEIESSSRLANERGVLYLSAPMHYLDSEGISQTTPLGLVLSDKHLLTIRFAAAPVFDSYAQRFAGHGERPSSVAAFIGLLEAIVDRLADVLEHLGAELDAISRRVFRSEDPVATPARTDMQLRATLRNIGRAGERLSNLRDSLLGVQRLVSYTSETASGWIPAEQRPRLTTLRRDAVSLADYDTQLSNKVQFLLDATLGFINIEQNNGIKVLTVVSVVGVPPTLVASIYGMNFKWIPELDWHYGYFYGLALIVVSGIAPLIWFKRRGWI
jgi:magnesium transporter